MVNRAKAMEVDGVKRQGKHNKQVVGKGVASGKAAKKEDKMNARKEKKMLAKMIRNKKTAAEFSNHKPKASKNTEENARQDDQKQEDCSRVLKPQTESFKEY